MMAKAKVGRVKKDGYRKRFPESKAWGWPEGVGEGRELRREGSLQRGQGEDVLRAKTIYEHPTASKDRKTTRKSGTARAEMVLFR
jgi:hypothetical protein